jgi:hypothetical protein
MASGSQQVAGVGCSVACLTAALEPRKHDMAAL